MSKQIISSRIQRRFVLGRQGLWPGRRWSGKEGAAQALRQVEAVQIDPVSVVAQSHDIVLWGRVLDYQPAHLLSLAYEDRQFFDYGGGLFFYPMEELPYWRQQMNRQKTAGRWSEFIQANPELIERVRQELRNRGPLRNRDVAGKKVSAYRSSKDTGVALYALWITGELMTYGRHNKERIYDFLENVAPNHLQHEATPTASSSYLIQKSLAQRGLTDDRTFRTILNNLNDLPVDLTAARQRLEEMVAAGQLDTVEIEGQEQLFYYLAQDKPLMEKLIYGQAPNEWQPLGPTTEEEIIFLSPLEYVSARRRALKLFDFDYIWEIYKPIEKRLYGSYTMPILYDDRLVARMDSKHDRPNQVLVINGLWLESWFRADEAFAAALAKGLSRFMSFLTVERMDNSGIRSDFLRKYLGNHLPT